MPSLSDLATPIDQAPPQSGPALFLEFARRSADDGRWRVIAYAPFNGRPIRALELERGGQVRGLSVVAYRSYPVGRGGVFVGELGPSGARTLAMPVVATSVIGATA